MNKYLVITKYKSIRFELNMEGSVEYIQSKLNTLKEHGYKIVEVIQLVEAPNFY